MARIGANLLEQNFQTDGPNRVRLSDTTYVGTEEGRLYLTTVEDLWSRRIVGQAITERLEATAIVDALRMALGRRMVQPGPIFHSDRGKQYVDRRVRKLLADRGMRQSMSGTGNCYDNAPAESFFATLKKVMSLGKTSRRRSRAEGCSLNISKCSTTGSAATRVHITRGVRTANHDTGLTPCSQNGVNSSGKLE
jgi:transposase InsO family protein